MELNNAVVAITGGAGGLGVALARHLGLAGALPLLIDLDPEGLARARDALAAEGIDTRIHTADIADDQAVQATFEAIGRENDRLDGLINNAGLIRDGRLVKQDNGEVTHGMSLAQWQIVIDTNLTGTFLCGREAAALMTAGGRGGCIVNVASIAAAGNMGQSNYAAAKAGVIALATTWARELAPWGIRSAAIAPGFIRTPILEGMKPEALDKLSGKVPAGRLAEPEEIADGVAFILRNEYFNGRVLEIDGGLRI